MNNGTWRNTRCRNSGRSTNLDPSPVDLAVTSVTPKDSVFGVVRIPFLGLQSLPHPVERRPTPGERHGPDCPSGFMPWVWSNHGVARGRFKAKRANRDALWDIRVGPGMVHQVSTPMPFSTRFLVKKQEPPVRPTDRSRKDHGLPRKSFERPRFP